MTYLIVRENDGFSPCWAVEGLEGILSFFAEEYHEALRRLFDDGDGFIFSTEFGRYYVSRNIMPVYFGEL